MARQLLSSTFNYKVLESSVIQSYRSVSAVISVNTVAIMVSQTNVEICHGNAIFRLLFISSSFSFEFMYVAILLILASLLAWQCSALRLKDLININRLIIDCLYMFFPLFTDRWDNVCVCITSFPLAKSCQIPLSPGQKTLHSAVGKNSEPFTTLVWKQIIPRLRAKGTKIKVRVVIWASRQKEDES